MELDAPSRPDAIQRALTRSRAPDPGADSGSPAARYGRLVLEAATKAKPSEWREKRICNSSFLCFQGTLPDGENSAAVEHWFNERYHGHLVIGQLYPAGAPVAYSVYTPWS